MSSHHDRITEIENPGPLKEKPTGLALTAMMLGVVAFAIQYILNPKLAWAAYLEGFFFALLLGMAGLFFVALNYLTKSVWSVPVRRIAEGMSSILPWTLLLFVPILINYKELYEWHDSHAAHLYDSKAAYLSFNFWAIRIIACLVIWNLFGAFFRNSSLSQDQHKQGFNMTGKACLYLIVFGYSFTIFSVDLMMSLRAHWFSTMYGVYCFAGMFQAGLCVIILTTLYLREKGYFGKLFHDRHLFDLGTWLLAWCTFMVYIGFSQFMLIWYANLPEETVFFIDHLYGEWKYVYILVAVVKWVIPFFILMPKPNRVNPSILKFMCIAILIVEWVDIHWLVTPEFLTEATQGSAFNINFVLSLIVGLGFLGLFAFTFIKFLNRNPVIAHGEPELLRSANGDYL